MDKHFEALSDIRRRQILVELLDHSAQTEGGVQIVEPSTKSSEESQIELYHNHLPRLAEGDFIIWNQDTDKVMKGPQFEEIRPLLELIDSHANELPEEWV